MESRDQAEERRDLGEPMIVSETLYSNGTEGAVPVLTEPAIGAGREGQPRRELE